MRAVLAQVAAMPTGTPVRMLTRPQPGQGWGVSHDATARRRAAAKSAMRAQSSSDRIRGLDPLAGCRPPRSAARRRGCSGRSCSRTSPAPPTRDPSTMSEDTSVVHRPANRHANRSRNEVGMMSDDGRCVAAATMMADRPTPGHQVTQQRRERLLRLLVPDRGREVGDLIDGDQDRREHVAPAGLTAPLRRAGTCTGCPSPSAAGAASRWPG